MTETKKQTNGTKSTYTFWEKLAGSYKNLNYEANSQTMKVSEAIVDIVKAILSPSEIQAVKCVLESLRSPQNEQWWNVFVMKSTSPSKNGSFQVIPCHEDCSG